MLMSLKRKRKIKAPIITVIVIFILLIFWLILRLNPIYLEHSASYLYSKANVTLNDAISNYCNEKAVKYEDFITLKNDNSGRITAVKTNSTEINRFKAEITKEIENIMINSFDGYVYIPLGSVLGSPIFSNTGPKIRFKLLPIGKAEINISSHFSDAGINQICHSLYLDTVVTFGITNSVMTRNETVNTHFLIGETVVVGDVPKVYGVGSAMQNDLVSDYITNGGLNDEWN